MRVGEVCAAAQASEGDKLRAILCIYLDLFSSATGQPQVLNSQARLLHNRLAHMAVHIPIRSNKPVAKGV
jgi:hypothetical protein